MKVYKQELLDGLSERIKSQASIAYCVPAVLVNRVDDKAAQSMSRDIIDMVKASSNPNQVDLYYIKSVLVSTGWNKNDDVFDAGQTWAARNTPEDKQFNFMHNENDIIGHITGSYVVDRNGEKIEATENDVPSQFDIITEAVIYNSWTHPENRDRMQKIISEIEQGKWFVSMECLFAGFDYAVQDQSGNSRLITRSEESAFLTKHLRAYGGTGEYEGYKIGRSLRDIAFSGKGLVSKPANPRSVILDSSKAFSVKEESSILNVSKGDNNMSDTNLEKQLADLQGGEVASSQEETKTEISTDTLEKEYAEKVSVLETSLAERDTAIKAFEDKVASLEETLASKDKELSELSAAVKDMKTKEKNRNRKEKLMSSGFEETEAEDSLTLYDALEDEAFEAIVAMYKKKMAKKAEVKENLPKDEKNESANPKAEVVASETETEVTEELFEEVNSTEATLVDASDVKDELEVTRASVAEWLTENVLRK
jgi:hypothetical protein